VRILALAAASIVMVACASSASEPEKAAISPVDFYRWDDEAPSTKGRMLRTMELPAEQRIGAAATNTRILYASTGWNGSAIVASGAYFLPGQPPEGGGPVLAWAHGTVGIADRCAPSRNRRSERDLAYLTAWLDAGYAIVAADYEGLGTKGTHPYLNAASAARTVVDAVAATMADRRDLSDRWAVIGQSQGGAAALATAALAPGYGSRGLVAAHATAPPSNASLLFKLRSDKPNRSFGFIPLMLRSWEVTEPGFQPAEYLAGRGPRLLAMADTDCYSELADWVEQQGVTGAEILHDGSADLDELNRRFFEPPSTGYEVPVLITHGDADTTVPRSLTDSLVDRLCQGGASVTYVNYSQEDHSSGLARSLQDSVPWMRARFEQAPIASTTCAAPS
jgi:pimeloyl-ACP methyl ester carboxylesterase